MKEAFSTKGKLYLLPSLMGDTSPEMVLPSGNLELLKEIRFFIVEDTRTARRFLKKCHPDLNIDNLAFLEIDKHNPQEEVTRYLQPAIDGDNVGLLSEAGCPAIADPGSRMVKKAHELQIEVIPLVGPSSILLSLMASGFNGQEFCFHGYLSFDKQKRIEQLRKLESVAWKTNQTQIFIETPYRNDALLQDILNNCRAETLLCVAVQLTTANQNIQSKKISEWKKSIPDLKKKEAIFLISGS